MAAYNFQRPHQSLDMKTSSRLFRPNGPTRIDPAPIRSQPPADE
ncbi:hypothetical protein AB0O91_26520 [Kitasatospora sp. NPDC089797]